MSIQIIDTFVELRKLSNNHEEIRIKMKQLESKYNEQFSEIYSVLQKLLENPKKEEKTRTKIGYKK